MKRFHLALALLCLSLVAVPIPARAQQTFGTTYHRTTATKTADYTVDPADDVIPFSHASTVLTATLHTPNGYPAAMKQGGRHRIVNSSSTQILLVATAAGSVSGPTTLYPGQSALYESDGVGTWYSHSLLPGTGFVQVSLAAADIIAMRTTPVSLIPAPGSGKIVVIDHVTMKMVRTSTAFTGGGAVEFRYTDGSGAKVSADVSATLVTGAAGTAYSAVRGVTTELTPVANAAVVITNATGVFAAGTGTGQVSIAYRVVTP